MTATQLFKWFCKEQRITHIIHKMFHEIRPTKTMFNKGSITKKYLTFEEYIDYRVDSYGFAFLLSRIMLDYFDNMRRTIRDWNAYWDFRDEFQAKLNQYCRKWEYFTRNNIIINEDSIKIGDNVKFNNWGDIGRIIITEMSIPNGTIHGKVFSNIDGKEHISYIKFGELLNEDETPKMINYSIKRNRKIYNGKN